jgi:hypothetical protein
VWAHGFPLDKSRENNPSKWCKKNVEGTRTCVPWCYAFPSTHGRSCVRVLPIVV